jgi:hypothetical protein
MIEISEKIRQKVGVGGAAPAGAPTIDDPLVLED